MINTRFRRAPECSPTERKRNAYYLFERPRGRERRKMKEKEKKRNSADNRITRAVKVGFVAKVTACRYNGRRRRSGFLSRVFTVACAQK